MNTSEMKNFLLSLQVQMTGLQLQVDALTKMMPEMPATPQQEPMVLEAPGAPSRVRESNEIVPSIAAALEAAAPPLESMSGKELIAARCRITGRTVVPEHWSETKAQIIADIKRLQTDAAYLAKVRARVTKRTDTATAPAVSIAVAPAALAPTVTEPKAKRVMSPEHKAKFLAAGAAARAAKKAAKDAATAIV